MNRANKLIKFVEEDKASYYNVEYYLEVGEHGGAGDFPNMEQALKKAREIEIDDDTWYVGIMTDASEFAIVYVTQDYIDLMNERDTFADEKTKETWMTAAQKALQSGKEVIGKW
jgi:hypothetical protein